MNIRNHEHYMDTTAYNAIRNVMHEKKKERIQKMNQSQVKAGEIWSYEKNNGTISDVLVLQAFDEYATVLNIFEKKPRENAFSVYLFGEKWVDLGKIQYCFQDCFSDFHRVLTESEFKTLKINLGEVLGLSEMFNTLQPSVQEPAQSIITEVPVIEVANEFDYEEDMKMKIELECLKKETEIYKGWFERFMEKAVNGFRE